MAEDFSLPATDDPYSVSSTGSWHKHYDYPVPGDGDAAFDDAIFGSLS